MKILIAEDEIDLREILAFSLESSLQAQILEAASGNEAIELIRAHSDIDVILCDYNMTGGDGGVVFKYLLNNGLAIPFILTSSDTLGEHPEFTGHEIAGYIQKPFQIKLLVEAVRGAARAKAPPEGEGEPEDYCRIRIGTANRIQSLTCDLFIKLSEDKYVKVVNRGTTVSEDDLAKYVARNVDYLYLRHKDLPDLIDLMTRELQAFTRAKKNRDVQASFQIGVAAHELIHELAQSLGMTEEARRLAMASVELAIQTMSQNPGLKALFKKLSVDPESYISSHSVALAFATCGIASMMAWNSESTRYKLALASFLHDLTLTDQKLARIQTLEECLLRESEFGLEKQQAYKKHPEKAAALVREVKDMPPDVDTTILQHHERPDGSGFPAGVNHARIGPLSSVMIIAHELLTFMQKSEGKGEIDYFLSQFGHHYEAGHFKKIISSMKAAAKKEKSK